MSQNNLSGHHQSSLMPITNEAVLQNHVHEQQIQHQQAEMLLNPNSKVQSLVGLVTMQIQNQIQQSRISIPQQKKSFQLMQKNTSSPIKRQAQKIDEKKIAQIVKRRKDLQQQMLRLKLQQQEQRRKSRSKSPSQTKYNKTFKSSFTAQEQLEISRIKRKSQQFQNLLHSKQKQVLSKLQQEKNKIHQQRQNYLRQLKERKKHQSLKKIQLIHQQQKSRLQAIREQNRRYQQVKNSKALHQKIQQSQKALEQLKRLKQQEMLRQKKRSMTLDINEIKQHERRYYETTRITKQKIGQLFSQRVQRMKQNEYLQTETFKPSRFLVTLMNEQKLKQMQENERIEKMKILFSKKNSFQQKLREMHKQKIKVKPRKQQERSIVEIKVQNRKLKAKSLSAADIYKQGQQYMKSAHAGINNFLIEKSKVQLQKSYTNYNKQQEEKRKTQYRNYLLESRVEKQKQKQKQKQKALSGSVQDKKNRLRQHSNPQLNRLAALIQNRSRHQSKNQKLYQAKLIAQKLDKRAKNSSTSALIDTIAAKLKIIEKFG